MIQCHRRYKETMMSLWLCLLLVILYTIQTFDPTLGYPGGGPKKLNAKKTDLSMVTWNSRSMTYEWFYFCKSMNCNVIVLTELWRSAHKFRDDSVRWTHSQPITDKFGNPVFPDDLSTDIDILLSERVQAKYLGHGSPCERITWVRLKGPITTCRLRICLSL